MLYLSASLDLGINVDLASYLGLIKLKIFNFLHSIYYLISKSPLYEEQLIILILPYRTKSNCKLRSERVKVSQNDLANKIHFSLKPSWSWTSCSLAIWLLTPSSIQIIEGVFLTIILVVLIVHKVHIKYLKLEIQLIP